MKKALRRRWKRFRVLCADLWLRRQVVLVLGDSHTEAFASAEMARALPGVRFETCTVQGATASGLTNPNSKTNAYRLFAEASAASRAKRAVVLLGEVDTGFVIWYRSAKHGEPVEESFRKAVSAYTDFLRAEKAKRRLICVSAPLPTIPDGFTAGEVANLRREVRANQLERTELTFRFNVAIEDFCRAEGIDYVNLDAASRGADGLVDRRLLHTDPGNHHYAIPAYVALLGEPLREALERRG